MQLDPVLETIIRRIASRAPLSEEDCTAIRSLPYTPRQIEPSSYLVREGAQPSRCAFVLSGLCYRQKLTSEGARQSCRSRYPAISSTCSTCFSPNRIIMCRS